MFKRGFNSTRNDLKWNDERRVGMSTVAFAIDKENVYRVQSGNECVREGGTRRRDRMKGNFKQIVLQVIIKIIILFLY